MQARAVSENNTLITAYTSLLAPNATALRKLEMQSTYLLQAWRVSPYLAHKKALAIGLLQGLKRDLIRSSCYMRSSSHSSSREQLSGAHTS